GALGRLYGPNPERGLFKTTDGGKTWERILFVDDKTGVIDIQMDPSTPETLLIGTWQRQRDGFATYLHPLPMPSGYDFYDPIKKWGPGGGIYKTTDGGKTFTRLAKGLPTCPLGRIGLNYYAKNPKIVYAVIDCEMCGLSPDPTVTTPGYLGITGQDAEAGAKITELAKDGPAAKAGIQPGDIIVAV